MGLFNTSFEKTNTSSRNTGGLFGNSFSSNRSNNQTRDKFGLFTNYSQYMGIVRWQDIIGKPDFSSLISTPSLQQVTDVGYTTTNSIQVYHINMMGTGVLLDPDGFIELHTQSVGTGYLKNSNTIYDVTLEFPNKTAGSYTIATTVDIPSLTGYATESWVNSQGFLTSAITSLNGTTNRIVTSGNTIDISTNYVGQSSITTLGTISTGTWNGTTITGTYGGTGVNNGSRTITIAGNLTTTGAFNTSFTQQLSAVFILPPVAGTIAASASTLTSGRMVFTTTSGMLIDSANVTWDDTNKRLFGANDITFGKSTSYNISFVGTTLTITSSNNLQINNTLTGNGIKLFSTSYDLFASTRTFINNYIGTASIGALGGSLTTRQSSDFSFTSGEATYTAGGGTTITAATGSFNVLNGTKSIGIGDRVALSNNITASGYATVLTVNASSTILTVDTAIGAAGTLTLNVKPANFRVFSNANVLQMIVNDLGYVGIGIITPKAYLHLAPSTLTTASLLIPSGTAPSSPIDGHIWFDGTDIKMRIGGVTKTFTLT